MSTFILGLTGGIGSGKTAASDWFKEQGIVIVDADLVSRQVVEPGTPALTDIRAHFGGDVILPDGALDRAALRTRVFANESERRWLEQLLHPLIAQEILRQLAQAESPYAILVSPLLFETGQKAFVKRTLLIDVPEAMQITRTTSRDNVPESQVKAIIAAQMPRNEKKLKADDVVINDDTLTVLHEKLAALHHRYLDMVSAQK
jgi:dephospho-CoA kinase